MIRTLAAVLVGVAFGAAAVVLLTAGSWRAALRVLVELMTAAGLVRLAAAQTWTDILVAAAVVAIRQTLSAVLLSSATRPPP